jgi:hypothetical protein
MGYNIHTWEFLNSCLISSSFSPGGKNLPKLKKDDIGDDYEGKYMLELGCQVLRKTLRDKLKARKKTSKHYFKKIGFNHISIDICGCYKSMIVDLSKPIDSIYHNKFDIVTNSGTTEHIYPASPQSQSQCFENIHVCTKKGGIMIHMLPIVGDYLGHSCVFYNEEYFYALAKSNNYDIVDIRIIKDVNKPRTDLVGACFIKRNDNIFNKNDNNVFQHLKIISEEKRFFYNSNKSKYLK